MLIVCVLYAAFALDMFRLELTRQLGLPVNQEIKERSTPILFLLHALLGGIGLVASALQFDPSTDNRATRRHRVIGWTYLTTIWGASLTGLWNAVYFDVPFWAKVMFWLIGLWWFTATTRAYLLIRRRNIHAHRHWMLRSFSISLFFITFPLFVPVFQSFLTDAWAWPLGLFLAATSNMVIVEIWIRREKGDSFY